MSISHLSLKDRVVEFARQVLAIWVFGAFWLAKSVEIRQTHANGSYQQEFINDEL